MPQRHRRRKVISGWRRLIPALAFAVAPGMGLAGQDPPSRPFALSPPDTGETARGQLVVLASNQTAPQPVTAGTAVSSAAVGSSAQGRRAGAVVTSVVPEGTGRYSIRGRALDMNGNPACALALANGRCMYTCGPGSLRCEGGTASLPIGEFELTNLPTNANGLIELQVFVEKHVSYAGTIDPPAGASVAGR